MVHPISSFCGCISKNGPQAKVKPENEMKTLLAIFSFSLKNRILMEMSVGERNKCKLLFGPSNKIWGLVGRKIWLEIITNA